MSHQNHPRWSTLEIGARGPPMSLARFPGFRFERRHARWRDTRGICRALQRCRKTSRMTRNHACIYCLTPYRAADLSGEPVVPAVLGGRLLLERAACADCSARVRERTDDFLARHFAPITEAIAGRGTPRPRRGSSGRAPSGASEPSPGQWRLAHRAAAKILYCYLLLELGDAALVSPPLETVRKYVTAVGPEPWTPRWEITRPPHSLSASWHVLSFDAVRPSAAAIGLFGTIWFRFRFDLEALAPKGGLLALDSVRGARGLAAHRHRGEWRYRAAPRWGWNR